MNLQDAEALMFEYQMEMQRKALKKMELEQELEVLNKCVKEAQLEMEKLRRMIHEIRKQ